MQSRYENNIFKIAYLNNKIECGGIKLLLNFVVENIQKKIKDKRTDEDLIMSTAEIAINTFRGFMRDSFRETYLHRSILPILVSDNLIVKRKQSK